MEDGWKVRVNIILLYEVLLTVFCLSQSEVSTDNRKVITFLHTNWIPTCSLPLLLSFLSGPFLNRLLPLNNCWHWQHCWFHNLKYFHYNSLTVFTVVPCCLLIVLITVSGAQLHPSMASFIRNVTFNYIGTCLHNFWCIQLQQHARSCADRKDHCLTDGQQKKRSMNHLRCILVP